MKKTKKMMAGVIATVMSTSLVGCADERPAEPVSDECDDWDWDEETATYYCDDRSSGYYRSYYYGGSFYKTKSALKSSSLYQSYKSSLKSGIGSGTKGGFGG